MSNIVRLVPRTVSAEPLTYTVQQAAELLGISRGSAYALVREGVIPATRLGGRWVIPRARFHAWLDGCDGDLAPTGTDHARRR